MAVLIAWSWAEILARDSLSEVKLNEKYLTFLAFDVVNERRRNNCSIANSAMMSLFTKVKWTSRLVEPGSERRRGVVNSSYPSFTGLPLTFCLKTYIYTTLPGTRRALLDFEQSDSTIDQVRSAVVNTHSIAQLQYEQRRGPRCVG